MAADSTSEKTGRMAEHIDKEMKPLSVELSPIKRSIDVIVPIYRGLEETINCITSLVKYTYGHAHLILINDCSPEPAITSYLRDLKDHKNEKLIVIENERNMGFVATANRGMGLSEVNDVVLLNSDTVVTPNWLDKLSRRAYKDPKIATVTPFTNTGSIFSYPRFCTKNKLIDGLNPTALNSLFELSSTGEIVDVPTGHGFCMYIKRRVLNIVGLFDVETFGKGYGEENDFCMRALKNGFRNVVCENTFIYHAENVSFQQEKPERLRAAKQKVMMKHPGYGNLVHGFIARDPLRILRQRVDLMRYATHPRPALLIIAGHRSKLKTSEQVPKGCLAEMDRKWRRFTLVHFRSGMQLSACDTGESFELSLIRSSWQDDLASLLGVMHVKHFLICHSQKVQPYVVDLAKVLNISFSHASEVSGTTLVSSAALDRLISDSPCLSEIRPLDPNYVISLFPILDNSLPAGDCRAKFKHVPFKFLNNKYAMWLSRTSARLPSCVRERITKWVSV